VLKSAWGSDDPTKAAFPFSHANALSENGTPSRPFDFVQFWRRYAMGHA
jgi:hypothetical protein